jgi:large subunit ribosomal protein L30
MSSGKSIRIAVVLIRGRIGINHDVKRTLDNLRLLRKHACNVVNDSPSVRGMLQKVKDSVTWGVITEETYQELVAKRGRKDALGGVKPFFLLNSPRGGFERKGLKTPYSLGGVTGNRKDAMNILLKKMM